MKKIAALIAIPTLAVSAHAVIIIDNFDEGSFNFTQTGVGSTTQVQTGITTSNTIGGVREVRAHNTDGPSNNNVENLGGQFVWNMSTGTTGHFHLYYGTLATTAPAPGAQLNTDFTTENGIALNVFSSDITGQVRMTLEVDNGEAGVSQWSKLETVPASVGSGGPSSPFYVFFEFSGFTKISGTGATLNLADVDGISFEAAADYTSADWSFDSIESVPEPSTSVLLGLSGAALLLRRRRA